MYLIPAIDLRDGKVVRLMQGDYDRQTSYDADPLEQANAFADAGCSWLHIVDLDGARSGEMTHLPIIEKICKQGRLKVEVGGGVRSEETIDALLNVGVTRVIMGTAALQRWDWFRDLVHDRSYHHKLVLGLDARKGMLAVAGWEKETDMSALDIARTVTDWPLAAIVYTDIATDGTLQGPNIPAVTEVAQATRVPVVASGGVGTIEHLQQLRSAPVEGVIVGRAIYEDAFSVEDAVKAVEG